MKPIIGIPCDELIEVNPRMPEDYPTYIPHDVKEAVIKTGAIPIGLPFSELSERTEELVDEYIQMIDGLLIPGGPDVSPYYYGENPIPQIGLTLPQKDFFERALINKAINKRIPILGICRGIQMVNVVLGGTLYQDVYTQDPDVKIQHSQATVGNFRTHYVRTTEGSILRECVGEKLLVNSRHHQAIKDVADGLKITAIAPDGIVEGLEYKEDDSIVLVQWHPENLWQKDQTQLKIFSNFVDRVQERKNE